MKTFSIGGCFSVGWVRFKGHAWFLVAMVLALYVAMFFFAYLVEDVYYAIEPTRSSIDFLSSVLSYWICFGMTVITLKIIDGKPYSWQDLFIFDTQVIWYLVGSILYGFMVVAGLIFFIVPGIYLMLRYGFFWYAIVDGRKNLFDAFKESARITDGAKWNLILFGLASVGVALLGLLAFGVGLLAAAPVIMLATAHLYRVLLSQSIVEPQVAETMPSTPSRVETTPEIAPSVATNSNSGTDSTTGSEHVAK